MKTRKASKGRVVLLLAAMMMMLVVSACSGGNKNNTEKTPDPAVAQNEGDKGSNEASGKSNNEASPEKRDPVTLTMVTNWTGEEPNIKAMFEDFNKHYPWITIKVETVLEGPAAIVAKAVALQVAGTPADLIMTSELTSGADLYEDLAPRLESDPDLKNVQFPESFLDTYKVNGKLLALPGANAAPFLIFVNKDLLEKHGMEMPAPDWTYDDMLEMAKKATDPAAGEWGIDPSGTVAVYLSSSMAIANGNAGGHTFLTADGSKSVANTPGVLADMQWIQELQTKHKVTPDSKTAVDQSLGDAFMQGKALFTVQGPWMTGAYNEQAAFDWDVLFFPRGTVSQPTLLLTAPFIQLSASKHKEEAWLYYKYMISDEGRKFAIDWGDTPWGLNEELQQYLFTNAKAWQGKNIDAIKQLYSGEVCCASQGMNIVDYGDYSTAINGGLPPIMFDAANIAEIFGPAADKFNATR
ncbi:extracellular solute-binding protein [Paenibacillus mendelii]|uniref:Extracellular solute-binding protein n=1 Tax=Paenibacillus mendelii TaxID=206163 RepID=A0ABV6JIS3_9BACL|nr:extracellular solute-binding protein [Paenibacillus mendelii]MCQ6558741.1 extracellular solute-binding protein [Paenibacillus mendelii]